jgi:hypothetical protein
MPPASSPIVSYVIAINVFRLPSGLASNSRRVGCEWGVRWDAIARVARYAV